MEIRNLTRHVTKEGVLRVPGLLRNNNNPKLAPSVSFLNIRLIIDLKLENTI